MTSPTSLLPQMTGAMLPAPSIMGLTDDEQRLVVGLSTKLSVQSVHMMIRNAYYEGTQRLFQLGISIPPQLAGIRTVVDWPRICIDPLVQRSVVDGFRQPGSTEIDAELQQHWQSNDLDAEAPLCFLDGLVYGRGYMIVGAPDTPGDSPLVTVESPLNLAMNWDPRTRDVTAAYQAYEAEGVYRAVLYLPDETISMSRLVSGGWSIDNRDYHRFGQVPVVRFANRARSADREGRSEITPAIMNTTDSACRSLLGMEIAREFYSIPHRYVLGAVKSDFVGPDGASVSELDMAMSKFVAFERDAKGEIPTVGQFQAFDPSVFTKIVNEHAQLMASYTQFPPAWFGETTTANPASADAIRSAQDGVNRRARQVNRQWSDPLETTQRLVWRFAHNGEQPPAEMSQLEVDWAEVATPTPSATSDAIAKQISEGSIPSTSDVTLRELGYSAVDRARLEQDRQADPAQAIITALANSIVTKLARADNAVAKDLEAGGVITAALTDAVTAAHDAATADAIAAQTPPQAPPAVKP